VAVYEYAGTVADAGDAQGINYKPTPATGSQLTDTSAETQASNLTFATVAGRSVRLTWTRGSREGVIVVMRIPPASLIGPAEGADYTGNPDFSAPPETTGTGNYVVYKGSGTSVLVTGLTYSTSYSVAVYEYSGTGATSSYLAGPAQATDTTTDYAVHNYDFRVNCDDCHNHSSFGARGPELKAVCSTCHNPSGLAQNKLEFGFEETPTTTGHVEPTKNTSIDVVDCGMCHELHNLSATNTTESYNPETLTTQHNLSFLRANVGKYVKRDPLPEPGLAYLHTDSPGNNPDRAVEGGNDADATGYCQVCHSKTDYHRSTDTAGADQCHDGVANDSCGGTEVHCETCHAHNDNFGASGGGSCIGCHSTVRGARPVITTQFDRASSHIPGGSTAVTQEDCEVCHDQTGHPGDGIVGLLDADAAGGPYEQPTADASTLATGEGEAYAQACLSCHDANGAGRLPPYAGTSDGQTNMSPFTGVVYDTVPDPDIRFPEIDATNWGSASHNRPLATYSGNTPMTCIGDGTNGCHGSGHGSEQDKLLAPADVSPAGSMTDFCYVCHGTGGPTTIDIQAEFAALAALNIGPVTSQGGATTIDNYHDTSIVFCNECHSPHMNNDANPVADPDTDTPLSTYSPTGSYNDDGHSLSYNSGGNYDPLNPEGAPGTRTAPDYIQFCLTCHDGTTPPGVTMAANMINIATAYNGTDQHGSGDGETGTKTGKGGLKFPWVNSTNDAADNDPDQNYAAMNCTTCHGAHGTGSIYNLRESITVAGEVMTVGGVGGFLDEASYAGSTTYTLPTIGADQADHYWGAWCTFCHKGDGHPGKVEADSCTGAHMHGGGSF
jgi:hypothetical protein